MKLFLPFLLLVSYALSAQSECPIDFNHLATKTPDIQKWQSFNRTWNCDFITYFFENGTTDIDGTGEEDAVRAAMVTWELVSNVRFFEVCRAADANIRIRWGNLDGRVQCDVSGRQSGGVLAAACPNGPALQGCVDIGLAPGDLLFDDAENWRRTGAASTACGGTFDLQTIALHELGHNLGIAHTDVQPDRNIVMRAVQQTNELQLLDWDDRLAVRSQQLYGFPRSSELGGASTVYSNQYPYYSSYSLDCIPAGYTVTWSTDYPLRIRSGQGSRIVQVDVPRNQGSVRYARVIATLRNICGDTRTFSQRVKIEPTNSGGGSGCPTCPQPIKLYVPESLTNQPVSDPSPLPVPVLVSAAVQVHLSPNPIQRGVTLGVTFTGLSRTIDFTTPPSTLATSNVQSSERFIEVSLFNISGSITSSYTFAENDVVQLPTVELPAGVYIATFFLTEGTHRERLASKKLIVW